MPQKVDVLILKGRCASVVGNVIHSVASKQCPTFSFSVDESRNPNLAVWQMMLKLSCFKEVQLLVFLFWLCLLFCRLL